jgi:hypothetical protein
MTQTKRNETLKRTIGRRLDELVECHLKMPWNELATRLEYATSSTLRQARKGETLISPEKMSILANIESKDGCSRVSIDWLLTGKGRALVDVTGEATDSSRKVSLAARVTAATPELQSKIEAFLDVHGSGYP